MVNYTWDDVRKIRKYPHLLGHLCGKTNLTPLHSKWMLYLLDSKVERVLMAHRGSYKTTCISEVGVIWYLMFHPDATIVVIRKSYTDAASIVRNIANMMMIPEVYDLLAFVWGQKWKFTVRREGKIELSVKKSHTKELSVEAMGVDSNITGQHFTFGISDDVVTLKDRISEAEREKTKFIIQEYRTNILNPGCHMVHIGTPWHKKDLFSILPPAVKFPYDATNLLSAEEINLKKTQTTPALFAINYKLEYEDDEQMPFSDPYIGKWHSDKVQMVRAQLDAAFDGEHYCALTIMGKLPDKKYNAVGFVFAGNVRDWIPNVARILAKYNCNKLYIEDNADREYTALAMKKHPTIQQNHIWIESYHEKMNKDTKIATYLGEIWKDIEWAEETEDEYLEMCVDWRPGMEPDDPPDSASSLIREANFSYTRAYNAIWTW